MTRAILLAGLILLLPINAIAADERSGVYPILQVGVKAAYPQMASFPISILFDGLWKSDTDMIPSKGHSGLLLQLEPGISAQKLNIGRGFLWSPKEDCGWSYRLSFLQTTSEAHSINPGQTYVGAEVAGHAFLIGGSIGIYAHTAGSQSDAPNMLLSIGFGVGFP